MSNASTKILEGIEGTWVSYGYDRVRLSMSPLAQLAEALELPALRDLAKPGWNFESREAVARLGEPLIRTRPTAAGVERPVPAGVWGAAGNESPETVADPALQAPPALEEVSPPVAGPGKPPRFS